MKKEQGVNVVVVVVGRGRVVGREINFISSSFFQDKLWDRNIVINMLLCFVCVFSFVKKIGRNSILSGFQYVRASLSTLYEGGGLCQSPQQGGLSAGKWSWWRWDWEAGAEDSGRGCLKWRERGA